MIAKNQKPELLAPVGDLERLKTAVAYGADAVYLGGARFSLRAGASGFGHADMAAAVAYAHERGVRVYTAVNIYANDNDIAGMRGYFTAMADCGVDAFIISDPGVLLLAREEAPGVEIHISTQANTTNVAAARFWHHQGAKRIILSRELSLEAIRMLHTQCPDGLRLEAFVHGAMCVAVSGRCLLSSYMTGRSANRGECAHPCRYDYYVAEEKRPGQFMPITEDARGISLFSSNDLCMVTHLPDLVDAGISSLKIEGRMKTAYYVATTTQTYRNAIDDLYADPACYEANKPLYIKALQKCAHRGTPGFTTGFYYGQPGAEAQDYSMKPYTRTRVFTGIVRDYHANGMATVEQRNKFSIGDTIEVLRAEGESFSQTVRDLRDEEGIAIQSARHPQQKVLLALDYPVAPWDMLAIAAPEREKPTATEPELCP